MARRQRDRLTDKSIRAATGKKPRPGMWADGLGLYLAVADSGSASWLYRYKFNKRPREMGIGSLDDVTLKEARELADAARRKARGGIDPLEEKRAAKLAASLDRATSMTFKECADAYIKAHAAGWSNAQHAAQWPSSLERHVYPVIGSLPVSAIALAQVMKVLESIWTTRPETASRVRGRIESILDWAAVRGYRTGENPARWRGHLESLLPKKTKIRAVQHLAALPYSEIADFMVKLRDRDGVIARALEFAILMAARTSEIIGARWDEIDLRNRMWVVPANRMKARREHRVPLSDAALAIVQAQAELRQNEFVFPGRQGGALGEDRMLLLAKEIASQQVTGHGFRSSFRDWAAERSSFPSEVAEMALGHVVGAAVERAYRRGDLFEKRRQLAEAWARYCATPQGAGSIVPIRGVAK
jgi:integrase